MPIRSGSTPSLSRQSSRDQESFPREALSQASSGQSPRAGGSTDVGRPGSHASSCATSVSGMWPSAASQNASFSGNYPVAVPIGESIPRRNSWNGGAEDREPQQSAVRVVVRFRPSISSDANQQEDSPPAWVVDPVANCVESSDLQHRFQFDRALRESASQEDVYDDVGKLVVDDVLQGYHGTVLAYGQTGSGKTYCMFGPPGYHSSDLQGLVPRAAQQVFDYVDNFRSSSSAIDNKFVIECNFFEVYCEQLRDLVKPGNTKLQVKELPPKGCFIEGLTHKTVNSVNEVLHVLRSSLRHRAAANTRLNNHSSRSHAIFTLRVQQQTNDGTTKNGKLTLVDLAGSEKVHKSCSEGDMLEEAKKINASLSTLGHVIDALADRRPHVPYRDSRLTRILEDSLGGNCRTTLLVACSTHGCHFSETLSSLRFAARAKKVCNYARINVTYACDRQLLNRIAHLRRELAKAHHQLERRFSTDGSSMTVPVGDGMCFESLPSSSPKWTHASPRAGAKDLVEQDGSTSDGTNGTTDASANARFLSSTSCTASTTSFTSSLPCGRTRHSLLSSGETAVVETSQSCPLGHELFHCERHKPWFCRKCGRISTQSVMECYRCEKCNYNACDTCFHLQSPELRPSSTPPISGATREDIAREAVPKLGSKASKLSLDTSASMHPGSSGVSTVDSVASSTTVSHRSTSGTPLPVRRATTEDDAASGKYRWLVEATPLDVERRVSGPVVSTVAPQLHARDSPSLENYKGREDREKLEGVRDLQLRLELERHRCASLSLELAQRTQESTHLQKELEDAEARAQTLVMAAPATARLSSSGGSMPMLPLVVATADQAVGNVITHALPATPHALPASRLRRVHTIQRSTSALGASNRNASSSPLRLQVCALNKPSRSSMTQVGTPRTSKSPQSARDAHGRQRALPGRHLFAATPHIGQPGRQANAPGRSTSPGSSNATPRNLRSSVPATPANPAVIFSPRERTPSQPQPDNTPLESKNVQLWLV